MITLILSLLFGSGGEHCDLALAVKVRHDHSAPELAVLVWREHCDLTLAAEVWHDHSDPELAFRVWRGTLRSSVCS